jgi:hypothetical protein
MFTHVVLVLPRVAETGTMWWFNRDASSTKNVVAILPGDVYIPGDIVVTILPGDIHIPRDVPRDVPGDAVAAVPVPSRARRGMFGLVSPADIAPVKKNQTFWGGGAGGAGVGGGGKATTATTSKAMRVSKGASRRPAVGTIAKARGVLTLSRSRERAMDVIITEKRFPHRPTTSNRSGQGFPDKYFHPARVSSSLRHTAVDQEGAPHRAARAGSACSQERRHGRPPHRRHIQPPHLSLLSLPHHQLARRTPPAPAGSPATLSPQLFRPNSFAPRGRRCARRTGCPTPPCSCCCGLYPSCQSELSFGERERVARVVRRRKKKLSQPIVELFPTRALPAELRLLYHYVELIQREQK